MQCGLGREVPRKMENVQRLHGPEQVLPEGPLSAPTDRSVGRFNRWMRAPKLYGRLPRFLPDKDGLGGYRKESVHH